jgi:hypothetical protein
MIRKEDIERAITTFTKWDNQKRWDIPKEVFKQHTLGKSEHALKTAQYILRIMEEQEVKVLLHAEDYDGTLWIINSSYYSMFFLAQYVLALDKKKLPKNVEDTHKITQLALMYYFIIKGSGLEGKKNVSWEDITLSRLSEALSLMEDAQKEAQELTQQRAKKTVEMIDAERRKRNVFTYQMTIDAELEKAKTSLNRAKEFSDIITEFISKKWKK